MVQQLAEYKTELTDAKQRIVTAERASSHAAARLARAKEDQAKAKAESKTATMDFFVSLATVCYSSDIAAMSNTFCRLAGCG